jgi:hypothetical protein
LGLENLKSIFAEGAGNNNSQISNRYVDISAYPRQNVEAVNFFGPENSYSSPLEKPIEGFTLNFNQSGYAVGDGFLGDSKYIPIMSNFETRTVQPDLPSLGQQGLGFGNLSSDSYIGNISDDIRFTGGIGWELSKNVLQVNKEGNTANLYYINRDQGTTFAVAGGINTAGLINKIPGVGEKIVDFTQKIGVEIPDIPFNVDLGSTPPSRYSDTVFELSFQTPQQDGSPFETLGGKRGIVFQALGNNFQGRTEFLRSGERSFVRLGNVQEKAFVDKIKDFVEDKVEDFKNFANAKIKDFANSVKLQTPSITDVGTELVKSIDLGVQLPDFQLPKPSVKLPKVNVNTKNAFGNAFGSSQLAQLADNFDFKVPDFSKFRFEFPMIRLSQKEADNVNKSLNKKQDLITPILRNNTGYTETESVRDKTISPRGLQSLKTKKYQNIGSEKYSENIVSKHVKKGDGEGTKTSLDFYPARDVEFGQDVQTVLPIMRGKSGLDDTNITNQLPDYKKYVEDSKYGMPFYFKDLRDNSYVVFRGYIEGLTENISPTWNVENYIGRSEPVYTYTGAERDVSFTLKLFAHTKDELDLIYTKLNKLTSLCYPQYQADNQNFINKLRMKPPLTKFRLGELFGGENTEMTGFIKSVNNTWPENNAWETEKGKRVPKYITSTIGYQIIHESAPDFKSRFYGHKGIDMKYASEE